MPARIFSAMSSLHAFLCAELMTEEADRCRQPKDTKQPVGEVEGSYEPRVCPTGLIGMDNLTSYFAPANPLARRPPARPPLHRLRAPGKLAKCCLTDSLQLIPNF